MSEEEITFKKLVLKIEDGSIYECFEDVESAYHAMVYVFGEKPTHLRVTAETYVSTIKPIQLEVEGLGLVIEVVDVDDGVCFTELVDVPTHN